MKTVFGEIMELARNIPGDGSRYAAVTLMVASMDQTPQGTLPADDGAIATLIGLAEDKWRSIKPKVFASGWAMKDGRWANGALQGYIAKGSHKPAKSARDRAVSPSGLVSFDVATASFGGVDEKRKQAWKRLHPAADIDILLAGLANWLLDNPAELAKTRNFSKRITNWIKRERVINPTPMLKDPIRESGPLFMAFWGGYHPARRINFTRAASVWKTLDLDGEAEIVMAGLKRWLESKEWNNQDGEFVPSPDKWLLDKRWLDMPAAFKGTAIIKDRSGRVVGHDRGLKERDYGSFGSFSAR